MKLRTFALVAAALAAPALVAQEGPRFGLQAGLNLPEGDLKDAVNDKMGFNIGAHMTIDLKGGHMIRPRLDYTWFPEYSASAFGISGSTKISGLSAGADYLYFIDRKPQGFYVTGGLALVQWKVEVSASTPLYSVSASDTTTKLGIAVGAGYQFNKTVGGELRYQTSDSSDGTLSSIQAGVTFRF